MPTKSANGHNPPDSSGTRECRCPAADATFYSPC